MKKRAISAIRGIPLVLTLVLAMSAGAAYATTGSVDIVTLFPNYQGDNGFYAQAYNPGSGIFRDLTRTAPYNFNTPGQSSVRPYVMKNSHVQLAPCVNGSIYGTEWAVLSWQVSQGGLYELHGSFYGLLSGNSTTARIFVNTPAQTLFSATVSGTNTVTFDILDLSLNAGDYLRFAIDAGTSHSSDLTGLNGVITLVPEPGSLIALLTGLLGLGGWIKRRS